MSTGGFSLLLSRTPHQFPGLSIIGRAVFILNLVFFCLLTAGMAYRFCKLPSAFGGSLRHHNEGLFFPAFLLSIATILSDCASYAVPRTGSWLPAVLHAVFWIYLAASTLSAIVQYSFLFSGAHLPVQSMTPVWTLPIFPAMLVGTLASAVAPHLDSDKAMAVCVAGMTFQGLGWTVCSLIYPLYFLRLMQDGYPAVGMRPTMFIAVGPPGFTALATIGIAHAIPSDVSYTINNPGALQVLRTVALWVGIWLWTVSFWFFALAVVANVIPILKSKMEFTNGWWAFVFPNVGFTISTAVIGEQLDSSGILWLASAMTILLAATWTFVLGAQILAVKRRQLLWPKQTIE
jgi:C4-dicarboxylate transporter/malic acid transport protein